MLNQNIRIDLHIHSKLSSYKEGNYSNGRNIVEDSNINNVDKLLSMLNHEDNRISLFSITDHNHLDASLYTELYEKLSTQHYTYTKNIIAGVEFDVILDHGKKTCHILTYFEAKGTTDYKLIETSINSIKDIKNKNDYFTRDEYERILKKIGLKTILIVAQRRDLTRNGGKNDLTSSTDNPLEYIQYGYFNGLEYSSSKNEGILKNNLKNFEIEHVGLVFGSDCHDWNAYPKHDLTTEEKDVYFTTIKALPTFRGLLLSLTSQKTRFNRVLIDNSKYIKSLKIGNNNFELSSGINAIIGENGSGKSLLIESLYKDTKNMNHRYQKLISENSLSFDKRIDKSTDIVVPQSMIVDNQKKGSVFGDNISHFKNVDNTEFSLKIKAYAEKLKKIITNNIQFNEKLSILSNKKLNYSPLLNQKTFYINITHSDNFTNIKNPHDTRLSSLTKIIQSITLEIQSDYYKNKTYDDLIKAKNLLVEIQKSINILAKKTSFEIKVKNLIINNILDYNIEIQGAASSSQIYVTQENKKYNSFIDSIISATKSKFEKDSIILQDFPCDINGVKINPVGGFNFTKISLFHQKNLFEEFMSAFFVKEYRSINKIYTINTKEVFGQAVNGIKNDISLIDNKWNSNLTKFIDKYTNTNEFIQEVGTTESIGNTLGEMSLVYYKFQTSNSSNWNILVIDQPEDNISNSNIKKHLLKYFNSLRNNKQLIFVTHNPLLVVNLDVDNVIHIQSKNNKLVVNSGCLEDEKNKILEIISEKMDGGVDAIEKRLKVYGK